MSKIIDTLKNPQVRKWIYGVFLATLVYLGGEGLITSVQQENLGNLAAAVVNLTAAGGFGLAIRKAVPSVDDTGDDGADDVVEVPLAAIFSPDIIESDEAIDLGEGSEGFREI